MTGSTRPASRRHAAASIALAAVLAAITGGVAACTAAATPAPSSIAHATGPADLILRYEENGGFVAPEAILGRYPIISVYGDGSVITEGPIPAIYPGPAMPNLIVTRVTETGIQRLLAEADAAGLFGPDSVYDMGGVADATTAQFTVDAGGGHHVIAAYALGISGSGTDATAAAARAKLLAFAGWLRDLRTNLAPDVVGPDTTFAYDALKVFARQGAPQPSDQAITRPPIAWPLAGSLAAFGVEGSGGATGWRCGLVKGTDLETLRPLLATATQITGWSSGGSIYTLLIRPRLPGDDSVC